MTPYTGRAPHGASQGPSAAEPRSSTSGSTRATISAWFGRIANATSSIAGTPWAFLVALGTVIVWAVTGPLFGFSDTWQLVINTGTTIVTFLMVFLIQNTQNRDAKALHIKLLRAVDAARNQVIDVEEDTDEMLDTLRQEFRQVREAERAQAEAQPACEAPAGRPRGEAGGNRAA